MAKYEKKSARPKKIRFVAYVDEYLATAFEAHCQSEDMTKTEGLHRSIKKLLYGDSKPPNSVNRPSRSAKIFPLRDIRSLIVLLMKLGETVSHSTNGSEVEDTKIKIRLLLTIERLLEILEEEEQHAL